MSVLHGLVGKLWRAFPVIGMHAQLPAERPRKASSVAAEEGSRHLGEVIAQQGVDDRSAGLVQGRVSLQEHPLGPLLVLAHDEAFLEGLLQEELLGDGAVHIGEEDVVQGDAPPAGERAAFPRFGEALPVEEALHGRRVRIGALPPENPGDAQVRQRTDKVPEPLPARGQGVLGEERDDIPCGHARSEVPRATVAELILGDDMDLRAVPSGDVTGGVLRGGVDDQDVEARVVLRCHAAHGLFEPSAGIARGDENGDRGEPRHGFQGSRTVLIAIAEFINENGQGDWAMRIFCTGVSGCDKAAYIGEALRLAKRHGISAKHFHVGDLFLKEALRRRRNLSALNILNVSKDTRGDWLSTVFERVLRDVRGTEHSVINTHAVFYWKKVFSRAIDTHYAKEYDPDMFITFIDNSEGIKERLPANPQSRPQGPTVDEIELWQNVEVEVTRMLADMLQKPHHVLPRRQPPEPVFTTMFLPELPRVYVSFPMSNLKDPKLAGKIDDFVEKLRDRFTVITPRAIEIGTEYTDVVGQQTVHRDLHWFIRGTDITIVYYPLNVRSTGVDREVKEAFETGKEVCMVDALEKSPFLKHFSHAIFPDESSYSHSWTS